MGKHAQLRVISTAPIPPRRATIRAPDPHFPPPVSDAQRHALFGGFASMLLLLPVEAGAGKVAELDGELLACWAEADEIDTRAEAICDAVEGLPESDPRWVEAYEEAGDMLETYDAAVARAVVLRAKAGLVLSYMRDDANSALIALSLARDVMGRA